tara:strand:- start:18596 stop:18745 length:150 start_codon:yes stop_codon:yes gene_type:complete
MYACAQRIDRREMDDSARRRAGPALQERVTEDMASRGGCGVLADDIIHG